MGWGWPVPLCSRLLRLDHLISILTARCGSDSTLEGKNKLITIPCWGGGTGCLAMEPLARVCTGSLVIAGTDGYRQNSGQSSPGGCRETSGFFLDFSTAQREKELFL